MKDKVKKKLSVKEILIRLTLVTVSVLITLAVLNIFIGSGANEKISQSISVNDSINLSNKSFALQNPDGFTDVKHEYRKPDSIFRIAVLGDSFIWGDGLPYQQAWSHKLERKLHDKYKNIEVLHWGINGWQTTDELKYYTNEGYKYHPDLLILGYVDNDPDMGDMHPLDPKYKNYLWPFFKLFPQLTTRFWDNAYASSYNKWKAKISGPENLAKYQMLLDSLQMRLTNDSVQHFCVLTPACVRGCYDDYTVIKPHLEKAGLEYMEVYNACVSQTADCDALELRANPANYHPGAILTDIFSSEVYNYLLAKHSIPDPHLK